MTWTGASQYHLAVVVLYNHWPEIHLPTAFDPQCECSQWRSALPSYDDVVCSGLEPPHHKEHDRAGMILSLLGAISSAHTW